MEKRKGQRPSFGMNYISTELQDEDFWKISRLVYGLCGINLKESKKALVRARLIKRLRALGLGSIKEYIWYLESDQGAQETSLLIDAITTNKTSFFREIGHFNYLGDEILPMLKNPRLRFWTAACSSGEEPISLSILLREKLSDIDSRDVRILASDISLKMLEIAKKGIYLEGALDGLPSHYLAKYFNTIQKKPIRVYQVKEEVRSLIKLAWLNLMDPWPLRGPFNVIFCRNVMIYFDKPTQQKLIRRFWELLEPNGYLFVGHSEGLSSITHNFRYIKPAIYMK
jgi:chemotaxis protein methyltransferase CheR